MNHVHSEVLEQLGLGILIIDAGLIVRYANPFIADNSSSRPLEGKSLFDLFPELPQDWLRKRVASVLMLDNTTYTNWHQRPRLFNFPSSRPVTGSARLMYQSCSLFKVTTEVAEELVCITVYDSTPTAVTQQKLQSSLKRLDRERAHQAELNRKLETTQSQLVQSEKLAGVGQLAAGVAHEINNPVCFIKSNVECLRDYIGKMEQLIERYGQLLDRHLPESEAEARRQLVQSLDIDFIRAELPEIMEETEEGIERIEGIVGSLKDFARVDSGQWQYADLNEGVRSTLKVVHHELKYVVDAVEQDLAELPPVFCLPAQLNQVFMNLLVNAAHAIERHGHVKVTSRCLPEKGRVVLTFADNGCGIEHDKLDRIFDPFFTTKEVGKGTGLGLSVSYGIIQTHAGHISVDSAPGQGSCFRIELPIEGPPAVRHTS